MAQRSQVAIARELLKQHSKNPRAAAFGLDATLTALDGALLELRAGQRALASALLEIDARLPDSSPAFDGLGASLRISLQGIIHAE